MFIMAGQIGCPAVHFCNTGIDLTICMMASDASSRFDITRSLLFSLFSASHSMSGFVKTSLFHIIACWWAYKRALWREPWVSGNSSDWACLLQNKHHWRFFPLLMDVFGMGHTVRMQINFSIAFMVLSDGASVVPSLTWFLWPQTFSTTFKNAFQHNFSLVAL